jgi:hypothetical protein
MLPKLSDLLEMSQLVRQELKKGLQFKRSSFTLSHSF